MYKRILAMLFTIQVLLSITACNKNEAQPVATQPTQPFAPTVTGTWNADVDVTEEFDGLLYAQLGSQNVCTSFMLPMVLTLTEDGTYTLSVDSALLDERLEMQGRIIWQIVVDQAAVQNGMTEEEASETLRKQGKSHVTLLEELDLVSFFENAYCNSGVWMQEGNVLFFADTEENLNNTDGYPMTLSEQQLVLEYTAGADENGEAIARSVLWERAA